MARGKETTGAAESGRVTEVVGIFADRKSLQAAIGELLKAGFERTDLSVLDSHDSLSAAQRKPDDAWRRTLTGLVGEAKYIEPLTAAGLILLASGPVGAAVAGAVAAGVGGLALFEFLSELQATPHTREFAEALKQGKLLLWVRAEDEERRGRASGILKRHDASNIHAHKRPLPKS
jgi:hypothetical protein